MSIKRQLPLTYAAIALIAVLAVSIVLLVTLRTYYDSLERRYVERNALAIAAMIPDFFDDRQRLQTQADTLSFLTQTRIEIFDLAGALLVDSGLPQSHEAVASTTFEVQMDDALQSIQQTFGGESRTTLLVLEDSRGVIRRETTTWGRRHEEEIVTDIVGPMSLVGLDDSADAPPSQQAAIATIYNLERQPIGHVQLSSGLAYSRTVLRSVTWGIVLAGAIAVCFAALLGWIASRRLTQPLTSLTKSAQQMAAGDLTTRTAIKRRDELGELGRTFNQMADQVEHTVASLQRFVADAAHELHTPLTALRTRLELVKQPDNHTTAAQQQVRHLQRISEDLLTLSRLDNELQPPKMVRLNWVALISARLELVAARAEQAQIDFAFSLPDKPVWVQGNAAQLQQVFDNLVDNALKFTLVGGCVAVELSEEGVLIVRDTGIGIEDIGGIFGRFHRAPNAAPYPGSGLGLAIVYAIVSTHHGKITVTSRPQHTEFHVALPLC